MSATIILLIIAGMLVLAGIVGLVLPAFPGGIVLFIGLLTAAWAENFQHVGLGTLSVLGVMTLVIYAVDFIAGALGAKKFGASKRAVIGASIGAALGVAAKLAVAMSMVGFFFVIRFL